MMHDEQKTIAVSFDIRFYQAPPETRGTGSASLAIPTLFLVSPDKFNIKSTNMVAPPVTRLTGSASLAIPTLFLVSPDKLNITVHSIFKVVIITYLEQKQKSA